MHVCTYEHKFKYQRMKWLCLCITYSINICNVWGKTTQWPLGHIMWPHPTMLATQQSHYLCFTTWCSIAFNSLEAHAVTNADHFKMMYNFQKLPELIQHYISSCCSFTVRWLQTSLWPGRQGHSPHPLKMLVGREWAWGSLFYKPGFTNRDWVWSRHVVVISHFVWTWQTLY